MDMQEVKDRAQTASTGAFRALPGTITQAVSQEAAFVLAAMRVSMVPWSAPQ